jgi:WD40 repeat protein
MALARVARVGHRFIVLMAPLALLAPELLAQTPTSAGPRRTIRVAGDGVGDPPVVSSITLSPDGELLAVAGDDHLVRIFNVERGELLRVLRGHADGVMAVSFFPDGRQLLSGGEDRLAILWDVQTGARLRSLPAQAESIYTAVCSPDGRLMAIPSSADTLRLYRPDGTIEAQLACRCTDLRAVAFSPDGKLLAAGARDGRLTVWRLDPMTPILDAAVHRRRIRALAFSPDGQTIAVGGEDVTIGLRDLTTGQELFSLASRPGKTLAVAFCGPQWLAAGGTSNTIRVWNLQTQKEELQFVGHSGSVTSLVYDDREKTLISGSYDTTIRFWDMGQRLGNAADAGGNTPR